MYLGTYLQKVAETLFCFLHARLRALSPIRELIQVSVV